MLSSSTTAQGTTVRAIRDRGRQTGCSLQVQTPTKGSRFRFETRSSACFNRAALGALTGLLLLKWMVVPWWVPPFLPVDSFLQLVSPTARLQLQLALAARPRRTCRSMGKDSSCKIQGRSTVFYLNPPSLIRPGQKSFTPWVIGP